MKILGIETSCDETALSVVEVKEGVITVINSLVNSQVDIHAGFGGVVPEVAARQHIVNIIPLLDSSLKEAGLKIEDIDLIAVTQGPGLIGSLMVGLETAKTLAWAVQTDLVPTNHLLGHLWSWLLPLPGVNKKYNVKFPHLSLIVSGGHTEIILVKDWNEYKLLGCTLDDAAGEAFDKVSKILGLGYPGGPVISRTAQSGRRDTFVLPRPLLNDPGLNFSFAGLKTAVLYQHRKIKNPNGQYIADMAASFEATTVEVLVRKLLRAMQEQNIKDVSVVGGVSANGFLRKQLLSSVPSGITVHFPELMYTGDNAAMVALAGYIAFNFGKTTAVRDGYLSFAAQPNLRI